MNKYLLKWILASLVGPIIITLLKSDLGGLILVFWPGSIMLLSLGAESKPITEVVYVWSMAVGSNIFLYLLFGFITLKAKNLNKAPNNEKT